MLLNILYYRRRETIPVLIALSITSATFGQKLSTSQALLDSALIEALENGRTARVTSLIKRGANPNATVNDSGRTLLMSAAGWGVEDDIRALVRGGARVNARQLDGSTALMYAVDKGRLENVSLLLRLRADPNLQDSNGMSATASAEDALKGNWETPFLHIDKAPRRRYWLHMVQLLRKAAKSRNQKRTTRGGRR